MSVPVDLEIEDGYGRYCPRGQVTLTEAVELVTGAIAFCRAQRVPRLLFDMTGLSGVAVPTRDDRFWIAQDWAQEAKGMVILALVAPPEYIDPGRFGVAAAADAGLKVAVFTSKSDAIEWLLAQ